MSDRFFSFVLQKTPHEVQVTQLVAEVTRLCDSIGTSVTLLRDQTGQKPAVLDVGGAKISVISKGSAVPAGTMEGAAYASIGWPEAKSVIDNHAAHLIIGCLNQPNDHEEALHLAIMTTFVTAAALSLSGGIGVYWASGQLMVAPEGWQQAVQTVRGKGLPVEDWINLFWVQEDPGKVGAVTEGARAFLGMEIEFSPALLPPADIADRLFGVMRYLLVHGAVLKDGDTIGQSETEAIRVRFKERGRQFEGSVIELTFEQSLPKTTPLPGLGGAPFGKMSKDRSTFGKRGRS